ncbi:MAG TPA: TlpA disulfide reductase family protein [Polyangiaceae bacterium]|nr:TlpA disulfide reductase family protein [Polyangiaceae bacterium]HYQ28744.1 TlpA disulfide reductase family protein [Polyangiaceae bacterium]
MLRRSLRAHGAVLASLLSCAAGCSPSAGNGAPSAGAPGQSQLAPPDFELSTTEGKSERLSEHLGKEVVLLDFWATFCEPCLAGMPHLDALYREHHAQGFTVLGISIDGPDSVAQVKTTVSKLGISFPILLDQETRVVALYNPKTSAPYSVLIGRDGRILKKQEGYTTGNASVLDRDVAAALAR